MRKTFLALSLSLLTSVALMAQQSGSTSSDQQAGKIGKMKVTEFRSLNAKGAAMVSAIKPTKTALSSTDNDLLIQVAVGGQKQLVISQAALSKVTNLQAKLLAQSEVEEQTNVAAKLTEIAIAKGITLPTGTDAAGDSLVTQLSALSGSELDQFYVTQSGIKGHQELLATMTTVSQNAEDKALKALATATLPVIRLHLKVSTDVHTSMSGSAGTSAK